MTKHMSPPQTRGDDHHGNEQSIDTLGTANQCVLDRKRGELSFERYGRQFSRRVPLADRERAFVTASREGEETRRSEEKSPHQDSCRRTHDDDDDDDEEEEEQDDDDDDDDDEKHDKNDKDDFPQPYEILKASLSSELIALNKEWSQGLTSQLYTHHLPHSSQYPARFLTQQRAAAMQYPESLPMQRLRQLKRLQSPPRKRGG
ncbi:hypothetical protein E4U42_003759 [Claviceps africana]|uniref:Uncharacterized protein n=1 Tax=Claviceps africana TaxID=83212 RepID=A0A8K0NIR0_9HYPO|nr:hypothetical protein E4U42_003759 [Claviceps africana]